MMILPLADALQNCLQNLTSRIAGVDNEQMTNRVTGMGAMLGFGVGAIKEQFNSPSRNIKNGSSNDDNSSNGLKGFVSRAKSIINPNISLSNEKDYNGNINPIRSVLSNEKTANNTTHNKNTNENVSNTNKTTMKSVVGKVAKTGFNATKAYLDIGAKMAEGDFNKSSYKNNNNNFKNNNFQSTEYLNKVAENKVNDNILKKLGDSNEPKE